PTHWWHSVFHRAQIVLVHSRRFLVAGRAQPSLRFQPPALIERIVQLTERVRHLLAVGKKLEAFGQLWITPLWFRQRRELHRIIDDESRLDQLRLDQSLKNLVEHL